MADFFTEFDIEGAGTSAEFRRVLFLWASGITNSKLGISLEDDDGAKEIVRSKGAEELIVRTVAADEHTLVGCRYASLDQRAVSWTTEIVANFDDRRGRAACGIRVRRGGSVALPYLPIPRKPYIFRILFRNGWKIKDGDLGLIDNFVALREDDEDIAARFITGGFNNKLPIIYVSAKHSPRPQWAVDPAIIVRRLSGMAHIIVEPSREFSYKMRRATGGYNAFDGAVGLYWPESVGSKRYIIGVNVDDEEAFHKEIYEDVVVALSNRVPNRFCTWNYCDELYSRERIKLLEKDKDAALEEFVSAFDAENRALKAQLADQDDEIRQLRQKFLAMRSAPVQVGSAGLLRKGVENDLYPNETLGIVLAGLADYQRRSLPETRIGHVLADLMAANPKPSDADSRREIVQSAVKDAAGSDGIDLEQLESIGFQIVAEKNHTKIIFSDDPRYTFTLPKTSGDRRAGRNLASDICSNLFPR